MVTASPGDRLSAALSSGGTNSRNLNAIALAITEDLLVPGADILDAGCGKGELGDLIYRKCGLRCDGLDIMMHGDVPRSYRRFVECDLDNVPRPPRQYDLIYAIEVIEHLKCPRTFVAAMHAWLKPGGVFLVSTPNLSSIVNAVALALKGEFRDFGDGPGMYPAHISPVLPKDLGRMMTETGLTIRAIRYSGMGRIPRTSRSWPAAFFKISPAWFSDNYFLIGHHSA